ncbi:hypothetical protein BBK82_35735 [Lentzea guizhouensis]|uniref:Uncharacterized protein n=1 Tax=Lentzea guizhouensis TaxID=1586287 RepID=A0A1B2HSA9_9PSEU|nr:hypothetical protein [Lentzea guizhouensis]ANZ40565.1 hypothetical protein BBK82_35735 [Lentzea guizhouensis]
MSGAYAIRTTPAALLPPTAPDELIDAAELLEGATLDITARPGTAGFRLDVGLNGTTSGRLKGKPVLRDTYFDLDIGYDGAPDDPDPARQLLSALQYANELARVYYSSGHTVVDGRIWEERPRDFPFPHWPFEDFSGYDIEPDRVE